VTLPSSTCCVPSARILSNAKVSWVSS
jgi:hypothetical protein